jgi:hypothetical protein
MEEEKKVLTNQDRLDDLKNQRELVKEHFLKLQGAIELLEAIELEE